jgi:sugar phosphate isomerase/epimerase
VPFAVSFMSANFVARQAGWRIADWGEGDRATNAWYAPLETFEERFGELLDTIDGFAPDAIDLWTSHLNPEWATDEHVRIASDLVAAHGRPVASLAGWFGGDLEAFERTCRIAVSLGRPVLGGATTAWDRDPGGVLALLDRHDLRLAFENHPAERTPDDMLCRIGDAPVERVGTAVDTGWWGTQGYDAARAIEELGPRVFHVHMKDVREAGQHRTCRFGEGVVPLQACVQALRRAGYRGALSVEHEPEDRDPSDEIRDSIVMLQGWLAAERVA